MIPELGHFALILALMIALVQAGFPLAGSFARNQGLDGMARPLAWGQFIFVGIAFAALVQAFLTDDFSVRYVAENSNTLTPTLYKVSAVWGGHEGSLLLWALMLAGWGAAVAVQPNLPLAMVARVISVMGMVSIGFLLFMLLTSNPFDRLFPVPRRGATSIPCSRTSGSPSTRRCSTWATWASRWPSPSPSRRCSGASSTPPGRAGRGPGRRLPGSS
jgi:cytochrome c-type biogenesis protein CcmF